MSAIAWTTIRTGIRTWVVAGSGLPLARVFWGGVNTPRPDGTTDAYIVMKIQRIDPVGQDWVAVEDKFITLADDVIESVNTTTDALTLTAHSYLTGDGPVRLTTTGTLPGGAINTDYWIIKVDANTIKLAETLAHAIAGTGIVDMTSSGTGTNTIVDTAETRRAAEPAYQRTRGMRKVTFQLTCFPPLPASDATDAMAILTDVIAAQGDPQIFQALSDSGVGISELGPITSIDGVINSTRFEARAMLTGTFFVSSEWAATGPIIEVVEIENQNTLDTFFVPEDPTP